MTPISRPLPNLSDPNALESLGVPALALDQQARTLCWNRAFLDLFPEHDGHIRAGEPYAENLRRFYRLRLDSGEMASIERYIADGVERHRRQLAPYEFEHRGQWIRVEVTPLDGVGRLRTWTPVAPPREGDRLAAYMAESGKRITDGTLDQIADGLIVRDAMGRIVLANTRFVDIYGLASPAEAIGKSMAEVLDMAWVTPAAALEARQCWADNSHFAGSPFELPLPGDRWVRVRERRAHDGNLIGTHVDVTDLYRLQRQAREAQKRAEDLAAMLAQEMEERKRAEEQTVLVARLASLGQMATGLAHELHQPLAIMSLAAENAIFALEEDGPAALAEVQQRLERIMESAHRARGIVDHLRIFGGTDTAGAALAPVSLNRAVKGALILTEPAIRSAGISLDLVLPAETPWVMGRPVPLEQVVLNLLLNARDAVASRGDPAQGVIRLALAVGDGKAVLTVADNGGGFSDVALQRALEPFFTTRTVGRAAGLGLSVAYSTVRAAGGTIVLANANGGAVVEVTLPTVAPPEQQEQPG